MGRLLLGFVVGVVSALVVLRFLSEDNSTDMTSESDNPIQISESSPTEPGIVTQTPEQLDEPFRPKQNPSEADRGMNDSDGLAFRQRTQTIPEQQMEPTEPIPDDSVDDDIRPLLEKAPLSGFHRRFRNEIKDPSWSEYMESQILAYLQTKPELAAFDIRRVACRRTICEIQVIGYGSEAHAVWVSQTHDLPLQPWFDFSGISQGAQNISPELNDVMAIVSVLHKD